MSDDWRALYPFDSRRFDRGGGIRMHYVDQGSGDPVLMVHGNPTWSFYYRDLAKTLLAAGHRVIVPDHVGMGLSDKPSDARYDHTLRSRIDDLERLMASLQGVGPVTLVVHDWGGPIGLGWALRDLNRVKSLVILNTAGALPSGTSLPWQLALARSPLGPLLVQGLNKFVEGLIADGVSHPMAPMVARGYRHPYGSWSDRRAVLRFVQDIPLKKGDKAYDLMVWLGDNLPNLNALPTLLAWGMKDFVFGKPFLEQFRLRLPNAEVRQFAHGGHLVLEDSASELLPLIRDFAKKHAVQRR